MKKFKLLSLYLLVLLYSSMNGAGKFLQNLYSSVRFRIAASNPINNLETLHNLTENPLQ